MTPLRAVIVPFLITRCAVLALFLVTLFVRPAGPDSDGVNSFVVRRPPSPITELQAAVAGGDAKSYVEIARDGYRGEITRVYPPAFPMSFVLPPD